MCFEEYAFQLHVYFISTRDIEYETGNKPLVCFNSKASRLCSGCPVRFTNGLENLSYCMDAELPTPYFHGL